MSAYTRIKHQLIPSEPYLDRLSCFLMENIVFWPSIVVGLIPARAVSGAQATPVAVFSASGENQEVAGTGVVRAGLVWAVAAVARLGLRRQRFRRDTRLSSTSRTLRNQTLRYETQYTFSRHQTVQPILAPFCDFRQSMKSTSKSFFFSTLPLALN